MDYTIALFLLTLGVAVTVAITAPFFPALKKLIRGSTHSFRFRKAAERLKRIDELLEKERWREALGELRGSLITEQHSSREAIRAARDHNQNILSRCLILAEGLSSRAENIGEVERLILESAELQVVYLKSIESYQKLRTKRAQESKGLPAWTRADFDRRDRELSDELKRNRSDLERAAKILFDALETPRQPEVTYH